MIIIIKQIKNTVGKTGIQQMLKVGEMGVGKMGVDKTGPTLVDKPFFYALDVQNNYGTILNKKRNATIGNRGFSSLMVKR